MYMYVHCVHFIIQFYINTCSINTVINTFLWYFYLYLQKCACYSLHGSKEQMFICKMMNLYRYIKKITTNINHHCKIYSE